MLEKGKKRRNFGAEYPETPPNPNGNLAFGMDPAPDGAGVAGWFFYRGGSPPDAPRNPTSSGIIGKAGVVRIMPRAVLVCKNHCVKCVKTMNLNV